MEEIVKKGFDLLQRTETVQVASVSPAGYPRVCAVKRLKADNFDEIYFSTSTSSVKARHFISNPKAGLSYNNDNDSVSLVGKVEIVMDLKTKKDCFEDWMINHFKGGVDDPDYCLLRFRAEIGTFYIGGEFKTVEL